MSEPKRYTMSFCPYNLIIIPYVHAQGEWVKFKDYDDLRKLDDSVIARDVDELFSAQQEVTRLKAEVERLTKAGDGLALFAQGAFTVGFCSQAAKEHILSWNAAKQGGQP